MDDVIWCYMVLEFWLASWRWFTCSTWINIVFFFRLLHYQEAPMIVASSGLATTCFSLGQLKQLLKGSRYMLKLCPWPRASDANLVFSNDWFGEWPLEHILRCLSEDAVASVSFSPIENGSFVWPIYVFDAESIATWRWHTELWAIAKPWSSRLSWWQIVRLHCASPCRVFLIRFLLELAPLESFGTLERSQSLATIPGEHNNPVNHNFSAD